MLYLDMDDVNNAYTVSILDITGQQILLTDNSRASMQVFNISHFKPGIYFLRLISNDKSRVYRFIKK